MSLFHILSNTILNLTVVEIPLEKDSKKWKNQNFNKNYVTLRWWWGWKNWSGMIPNGETYSKDTMRGIFSNPKKNFFNFLTFGKNPKVQPSMVLRRIFLSKGFSSVFNGWIRIFFNDRLIIGGDDSRSNWVSREVFRRETETKKTTTTIQRCPCFIFFQILYSILQ